MDPSAEEMAALASKLSAMANDLAQKPDQGKKKEMQKALVMQAKQLIWQCQPPFDAIMDLTVNAYTIGSISSLMEIGVFEAIPPVGTATVKEIASKCNADEQLIIRLMRQLAAVNMFNEVQLHKWSHNRLSIVLSDHAGISGKYFFQVCMDEMYPALHSLNKYLRVYGKTDVKTYTETPHSWINNKIGQTFWQVLTSEPERLALFSRGLSLFSAIHPVVAMFPFATALSPGNSASRVLAVDVGGGRGSAMLALREGCPNLQGELILQDLPHVLDDIPDSEIPGVTKMAHDFFTMQPVRNAQIYLIRRVMHDWLDDEAVKILKALVPAMGPDSRVLVSDMALPDPVTPEAAHAVWMDLMMLTIGGKERTKRDWAYLAEAAGLKMRKVWQEQETYGPLCVVEYVLPGSVLDADLDE